MQRLTVVLASTTLPSLGAWNNGMRVAGCDVILDPHPKYDDPQSLPVIVCGHDAVVELKIVPASERASWFPPGLSQVGKPEWVALFEWREDNPFETAAAHTAAASLAELADGMVFGADGVRGESVGDAYRRARDLLAALPQG